MQYYKPWQLRSGDEAIIREQIEEAEATVASTLADASSIHATAAPSIGRAHGGVAWVVHPSFPSRLMAPGEIGELYLEGPLIGKGYYKDPERTSQSFVRDPEWLLRGAAIPAMARKQY